MVMPVISVSVPKGWIEMVKRQASAEERTMSALIRFILKEYCEGRIRWKEKWE